MTLDELPIDLIITIAALLDVPSVLNLSSCCKHFWRCCYEENREVIFRRLGHHLGYFADMSSNDTGLTKSPHSYNHAQQSQLQNAIMAQKCARGSYDDCANFFDIVRRRYVTDSCWKRAPTAKEIVPFGQNVWRFKVDTDRRLVLASDDRQTLMCVSLLHNGPPRWQEPELWFWTHLELSEGYLAYHYNNNFKTLTVSRSSEALNDILTEEYTELPRYKLFRTLITPLGAFCYKLRYPLLATGSYNQANELVCIVHNVETGEIAQSFPVDNVHNLGYIELDSQYLFLAGHSAVYMFSQQDGSVAGCLPSQSILDRGPLLRFTAIHHDEKRNILVALAGPYIFITNNYRAAASSPELLSAHSIIGHFRGSFGELSVENGRAVMTLRTSQLIEDAVRQVQSLLLIHIPERVELSKSRPTLHVIQAILPTDFMISRLEQDSTNVYLTAKCRTDAEALSGCESVLIHRLVDSMLGIWMDLELNMIAGIDVAYQQPKESVDSCRWPFHRTADANDGLFTLSFASNAISTAERLIVRSGSLETLEM